MDRFCEWPPVGSLLQKRSMYCNTPPPIRRNGSVCRNFLYVVGFERVFGSNREPQRTDQPTAQITGTREGRRAKFFGEVQIHRVSFIRGHGWWSGSLDVRERPPAVTRNGPRLNPRFFSSMYAKAVEEKRYHVRHTDDPPGDTTSFSQNGTAPEQRPPWWRQTRVE